MKKTDLLGRYHVNTHEEAVVNYIYSQRSLSHFQLGLYSAIFHADANNLARLRLGFPGEVAALMAWRNGNLRERAEGAGLIGQAVGVA